MKILFVNYPRHLLNVLCDVTDALVPHAYVHWITSAEVSAHPDADVVLLWPEAEPVTT